VAQDLQRCIVHGRARDNAPRAAAGHALRAVIARQDWLGAVIRIGIGDVALPSAVRRLSPPAEGSRIGARGQSPLMDPNAAQGQGAERAIEYVPASSKAHPESEGGQIPGGDRGCYPPPSMASSSPRSPRVQLSPNRAMLRAVGFGDGDFDKADQWHAMGTARSPCKSASRLDRAGPVARAEGGAMPQTVAPSPSATANISMAPRDEISLVSRE